MDIFEELELIEELDEELERLEVENDDTLDKLLKGEIPVPSKKRRISHAVTTKLEETKKSSIDLPYIVPHTPNENSFSNNNYIQNNDDFDSSDVEEESAEESDDEPAEFKTYKQEAANMSNSEKLHFYKKHLHTVQSYLESTRAATFEEFIIKTDKLFLSEHLLNEIDRIRDKINDEMHMQEAIQATNVILQTNSNGNKVTKKSSRTVSFANEDDVASFCKYEEPRMVSMENRVDGMPMKTVNDENKTNNETLPKDKMNEEKERIKEYVVKMANLNLDEVTKAMKDIYKEKVCNKYSRTLYIA